ncbi:hypothetical protein ACNHYB_02345 [Isoptericola jiangsuensis]|uniref:hypothetical protein n=1 Tax=Isoptericola jiangsuensis TaxID=548579 RepID=UPI003AAA590F
MARHPAAPTPPDRALPGVDACDRRLSDVVSDTSPARSVVRPHHVGGGAAWQVLVRDGALREVVPGAACPPGVLVDAGLRALLIAPRIPPRTVVTGRTAAWVHTGAGSADALDLACVAGRHRPERPAGARLWQAPLLHPDTVRIGPVLVTDPTRTVVELVLHTGEPDLVVALARHGADLVRARRAVEVRPRASGRAAALITLDVAVARL